MIKILLIPVVLFVFIETTECVSCYKCDNHVGDNTCAGNTTTCGLGQSCFKSSQLVNGRETMSLGCLPNSQCSGVTGTGAIVGRDVYTRQSHNCLECCSSDMCNEHLCNHLKPSSCMDDESVDCAKMNSIFSICNDIQHAKNVCPQFCNLCKIVDGEWSTWSVWSHCDVSCNNGTITRTRSCTNPSPQHGGLDCVGTKQDVQSCYTATVCPVNGEWSVWNSWGTCSATCDTGLQHRTRNCSNPVPAYNGQHCFGANSDARLCRNKPCVDGGWSTWSSWSQCSTTCGIGIRSKTRSCNNPAPSPYGQACIGSSIQVDMCHVRQDCKSLSECYANAQDGVYDVMLWKTNRTKQVFCDMTTDGGGWTVFQKRYDGTVDFFRNFSQYVHGFGDLQTEFWLGLDYVQEMISQTETELRIDLMSANGTTAYEVFSRFSLLTSNYVISIGPTTSSKNINTSMDLGAEFHGRGFITYDHNFSTASSTNYCGFLRRGAWWYNDCQQANLNGLYLTPGRADYHGIFYKSFNNNRSLKQTKMSFRRKTT